jgi:hypothetical protein
MQSEHFAVLKEKRAMFHRHRRDAAERAITSPLVHTVRLLKSDEELQAAVERARKFESRGIDQSQRRVVNYERYLRGNRDDLAQIVGLEFSRTPPEERQLDGPEMATARGVSG